MTDEKHTTMQEQLKEIFDNVNNWVTFAEAKNAAIIAFNVACISCIWDIEGIKEIKILPYIWGRYNCLYDNGTDLFCTANRKRYVGQRKAE